MGAPVTPSYHSTPSKRRSSSFLDAKRLDRASCPAARMFAAKTPPSAIKGCVLDVLSAHTRTRGGVRETLVKAETVMPWIRPPERAVTIVTPLGQWRRPSRNSSSVTGNLVPLLRVLWPNVPGGRLGGTSRRRAL